MQRSSPLSGNSSIRGSLDPSTYKYIYILSALIFSVFVLGTLPHPLAPPLSTLVVAPFTPWSVTIRVGQAGASALFLFHHIVNNILLIYVIIFFISHTRMSARTIITLIGGTLLPLINAMPTGNARAFQSQEIPLYLPTVVTATAMVVATLNIRNSFMARASTTVHTLLDQMSATQTKILVLTETGYITAKRVQMLMSAHPSYHIYFSAVPSTDTCHPRNQGVAIIVHKTMMATIPTTTEQSHHTITPYRTIAITLAPAPNVLFHIVGTYAGQTPDQDTYTDPLLQYVEQKLRPNTHAEAYLLLMGDINDISSPLDTNNPTREINPHGLATALEVNTPLLDIYRTLHEERREYTYISPNDHYLSRIDTILVSPNWLSGHHTQTPLAGIDTHGAHLSILKPDHCAPYAVLPTPWKENQSPQEPLTHDHDPPKTARGVDTNTFTPVQWAHYQDSLNTRALHTLHGKITKLYERTHRPYTPQQANTLLTRLNKHHKKLTKWCTAAAQAIAPPPPTTTNKPNNARTKHKKRTRHVHTTTTVLKHAEANIGIPARLATTLLQAHKQGTWLTIETAAVIDHMLLLAKHPNAHPLMKQLHSTTPTPIDWPPLLTQIITQHTHLVQEADRLAKEKSAQIIQEWMHTRHQHTIANQTYKSLAWLSTKQRPRGKVHSAWRAVNPPPTCQRYGCKPAIDPAPHCTRCSSSLYASALPTDIATAYRQHFQHQFRERPPLDPDLFVTTPHPTNKAAHITTALPAHLTASLPPEKHTFSHVYTPPPQETTAHYAHIMDPISTDEWGEYVKELSTSAPGPTKFSYALLKHSPPLLQDTMRIMTNCCLALQDVPAQYRQSYLFPIPKVQGAATVPQFRPIALAEIGHKLLTGILTQRITTAARTAPHQLFNSAQFGGVFGRSTEDALLLWHNTLDVCHSTNTPIHALYADVSAAYDSVSTASKTLSYWHAGLPQGFLNLVAAMDTGGQATVLAANTTTDPIDLECGFRQGDPLSPLGWVLFLNPLLNWLEKGLPTDTTHATAYKPTDPTQRKHNGAHKRYPARPCEGAQLPHQTTAMPALFYLDDCAIQATSAAGLAPVAERTSTFLNLHKVYFHPTKTKYQTTEEQPQQTTHPPAVYTQDKWVAVTQTPADTPIRYLGIYFTLTNDFTHQINLINKATSLQLQRLRATRATLKETHYTIQTCLIPALLYKLKFTPNAYTIADAIDLKIITAYKRATGTTHGQSNWAWVAPTEHGGMGFTRLRTRLLTDHISMLILTLSQQTNTFTYRTLTAACGAHMLSLGVPTSPFFTNATRRPTPNPPQWSLLDTIYGAFHEHGITLTTRENLKLVTAQHPDTPALAMCIPPALWTSIKETLIQHDLLYVADIATQDGQRMLPWPLLCTTRATLPNGTHSQGPTWYRALRSALTHNGKLNHTLEPNTVPPPGAHTPYRHCALTTIIPTPDELPAHLFPNHRTLLQWEGEILDPCTCIISTYSDGSAYYDRDGNACRGFCTQITALEGKPTFTPPHVKSKYQNYTLMGTSIRLINSYIAEIYGLLGSMVMVPLRYSIKHHTDNLSVISITGHFGGDTLRKQLKTAYHNEYRAIGQIAAAKHRLASAYIDGYKVKAHDTDEDNNRVDLLAKEAAQQKPKQHGEHTPQSLFLDDIVDYFAPSVWFTVTTYEATPTTKLQLTRSAHASGTTTRPTASIAQAVHTLVQQEALGAYLSTSSQVLTLPTPTTHNIPLLRRALRGQIHSPHNPYLYSEIARLYLVQSNMAKKALANKPCPLCGTTITTSLNEHAIFRCTHAGLNEARDLLRMSYARTMLSIGPPNWWEGHTDTPLTVKDWLCKQPLNTQIQMREIATQVEALSTQSEATVVELQLPTGPTHHNPTAYINAASFATATLHISPQDIPDAESVYHYFAATPPTLPIPPQVLTLIQKDIPDVSTSLYPGHPYLHPIHKIITWGTQESDEAVFHGDVHVDIHLATPNQITFIHLPLSAPGRKTELEQNSTPLKGGTPHMNSSY